MPCLCQLKYSDSMSGYCSLFLAAVLLLSPLIVVPGSVCAEEVRYVQPSCEVMLRRGQGTEFKILEVLSDGARVELLEETDLWARVRSEGGREGWIPRRFLTGVQPAKNRLAELEQQRNDFEQQNRELQERLAGAEEQLATLEDQLNLCLGERDKATTEYADLKKKTASLAEVEKDQKKWQEEIEQLRSRLSSLETDNIALRKSNSLRWFLAGSAVLLIGWLLGLVSGRRRRRKSSLL